MWSMKRLLISLATTAISIGGFGGALAADDLVAAQVPAEDPGPPFYARVTPIMNELFFADDWLVIPFYRAPTCIPSDFDLLDLYHFPSDDGPGAFACRLLVEGVAYAEPDALPTDFPKRVTMDGSGTAEVWFVRAEAARDAIASGSLTLSELQALDPIVGIATTFREDLQPRAEDHRIVIESSGTLEDGRSFAFDLVHEGETIESITVRVD